MYSMSISNASYTFRARFENLKKNTKEKIEHTFKNIRFFFSDTKNSNKIIILIYAVAAVAAAATAAAALLIKPILKKKIYIKPFKKTKKNIFVKSRKLLKKSIAKKHCLSYNQTSYRPVFQSEIAIKRACLSYSNIKFKKVLKAVKATLYKKALQLLKLKFFFPIIFLVIPFIIYKKFAPKMRRQICPVLVRLHFRFAFLSLYFRYKIAILYYFFKGKISKRLKKKSAKFFKSKYFERYLTSSYLMHKYVIGNWQSISIKNKNFKKFTVIQIINFIYLLIYLSAIAKGLNKKAPTFNIPIFTSIWKTVILNFGLSKI